MSRNNGELHSKKKLEGEMDATTQSELQVKIKVLLDTYKIEITPQANVILGECVAAILVDPHASWHLKKGPELHNFQADMLNALPSKLAQMANKQKLKKITSFDLLHNMTNIINSICPFDKPPP
jgi:hypothetical protein